MRSGIVLFSASVLSLFLAVDAHAETCAASPLGGGAAFAAFASTWESAAAAAKSQCQATCGGSCTQASGPVNGCSHAYDMSSHTSGYRCASYCSDAATSFATASSVDDAKASAVESCESSCAETCSVPTAEGDGCSWDVVGGAFRCNSTCVCAPPPPDAGVSSDAGLSSDAGASSDASAANVDAGAPVTDGGEPTDAPCSTQLKCSDTRAGGQVVYFGFAPGTDHMDWSKAASAARRACANATGSSSGCTRSTNASDTSCSFGAPPPARAGEAAGYTCASYLPLPDSTSEGRGDALDSAVRSAVDACAIDCSSPSSCSTPRLDDGCTYDQVTKEYRCRSTCVCGGPATCAPGPAPAPASGCSCDTAPGPSDMLTTACGGIVTVLVLRRRRARRA
ncbi:MAG: hypothetical protein KF795_16520 [Labilithrix sp.]|nr:hypothetical protein [Labilithrix sp.]